MKIFKKAKRGFTLVELVVVIAVIAILAAVSVGAYFGVTESANKSKLEQESKQFHTAIQTVALRGNADYTLNADGLRVSDIDAFELALEGSMGQDVEVLNNDPTYIAKQTIVLKTSELVKSEEGAPVVYKTFEYYTAEISGKKIAVDVVTGDFEHDTHNAIIDKEGADITGSTLYYHAPKFTESVEAYLWAGEGETKISTTVALQKFAGTLDIWAFSSSSQYTHVKFTSKIEKSDTPDVKDNITLPLIEANTPYYDNGWKALPNIVNAETTGKTVYINHWNTAEKVYAYAFTYNEEKNAKWPGVEMTRDPNRHDKLASYTFDKDYYYVIFNNGNGGAGNETDSLLLSSVDFASNKCFYNVSEKTWTTKPDDNFTAPTSVGLKGSMNGWTKEFAFTASEEGKVWTLENQILMANDEFKFTINGDYALNYSNLSEEDKANFNENKDYQNIIAKESAYYTFVYNAFNNTLSITKGEAYNGEAPFYGPDYIGIIGSFEGSNWETTISMTKQDNGRRWTVEIPLKENDLFKLRNSPTEWGDQGVDNWGYGIAQELTTYFDGNPSDSNSNIKVKLSKIYTLEFNYETKKLAVLNAEDIPVPTATLTIVTTPENAEVVLTAEGYTQSDKSITVPVGTTVSYTVSLDGYVTQSSTYTVNEDHTLPINLIETPVETATLTVVTTPENAEVVLTAEGYTQSGKSITVEKGTVVSYKVSLSGYNTEEDQIEVTEDSTLTIELDVKTIETFTIYFENNWLWTNVCVYYWGSEGSNPEKMDTLAMTDTGHDQNNHDVYTFNIPEDVDGYIISGIKDNGSEERDQSPNIEPTNSNFNNENGYWSMDWDAGNLVNFNEFPHALGEHDYGENNIKCTTCGNDNPNYVAPPWEGEPGYVYLKPNSNWTQANAWFAICLCNGSKGEKWVKMDAIQEKQGYYAAKLPDDFNITNYKNIIFVRMDSGKTTLNWSSKWNQTGDLDCNKILVNNYNCCAINSGQWDCGSNVTWSKI